jgi:HEAT repeat protein
MSSANDEQRYRELLALPLGSEAGLGQLLSALRDDSWRVRKVAVERLSTEVSADLAVPRLIEALSDQDDASLRNSALEALVCYGSRAVPALCEALESEAADLRKFALDALGEIRSQAALPSMRASLSDEDPNVRTSAIEALGKLGTPAALDDLLQIAGGEQVDLKLTALDALGRSEARVPFSILETQLGDRYLRRAAVRALGRSDGEHAERAILTAAVDPTRGTREAAFAALAIERRGSQSSWQVTVGALGSTQREALSRAASEMLGAEDLVAAEGAAYLLAFLGVEDAAVSLVLAADREELRAHLKQALILLGSAILERLDRGFAGLPAASRCLAFEALSAIALVHSDPQFREGAQTLALRWLGEDQEEVSLSAMAVLGAVGDVGSVGPLFESLADPELAEAAVQALQEIGVRAPEALLELCRSQLLSEPGPDLFRLLGHVGTREDLPTLQAALRGGAPADRRAAAEGLAALGLPDGANLLRTALTDEDAGVRMHAARGLAGMRSPEATVALVAVLQDSDPSVAAAAAEGLGACGFPERAKELVEVLDRELSKRPVVALAALKALDSLGKADARVLVGATQNGDPELAKAALRIAATQGLWPIIHSLAQHSRWDVRSEVAAALGREGTAEAEALLGRMQDQEHDALARRAVASALAVIADSRPA